MRTRLAALVLALACLSAAPVCAQAAARGTVRDERRMMERAEQHPIDPSLTWVGAALVLGFVVLFAVDVVKTRRWQRDNPSPPRRRR